MAVIYRLAKKKFFTKIKRAGWIPLRNIVLYICQVFSISLLEIFEEFTTSLVVVFDTFLDFRCRAEFCYRAAYI